MKKICDVPSCSEDADFHSPADMCSRHWYEWQEFLKQPDRSEEASEADTDVSE